MLDELPKARSIDLERVFQALCAEEQQRMMDDRRATGRLPFVRPLTVHVRSDVERIVEGFTRNISPLGVGIVSKEAFERGDIGQIEIHRFNRSAVIILAECRWADTFGSNWYFSGWSFLSVVRD